jgi:invasion protein IalB
MALRAARNRWCVKAPRAEESGWSVIDTASTFAAMKPREVLERGEAWRLAPYRLSASLAAVVLLAILGSVPVLAQQTPEAPAQEAPAPQPEAPLDLTERQFQDWMLRCGRSQQGPEICEMQQEQTNDDGEPIMGVAVGTAPGTSNLVLLVMLPLGILLPPGVSLQVDGGAETPLEVQLCDRRGCRIEKLVEPELLNRLKAGRAATVFFQAPDPQGRARRVGVSISLLGFTAALNELTG